MILTKEITLSGHVEDIVKYLVECGYRFSLDGKNRFVAYRGDDVVIQMDDSSDLDVKAALEYCVGCETLFAVGDKSDREADCHIKNDGFVNLRVADKDATVDITCRPGKLDYSIHALETYFA